jgi:hypothetical protein
MSHRQLTPQTLAEATCWQHTQQQVLPCHTLGRKVTSQTSTNFQSLSELSLLQLLPSSADQQMQQWMPSSSLWAST